ncbi:UDP-phosphate alpha-N-acetyl-D-fucosaminephosphotransferase [Leucobacter insecticola]|uniref:UDP-phosphate alpha-N-acetyl-D-fucosaminephosphotransferase n=2 Tax=Leucobacter insecticola TaxID=2714934 RepID=A0A6G8FMN7_9MICO|nr:UDP-phosphate alpha-N-acetyl-D-fucosaminephosphotransferase [Leucobacter insecticola]
MDVPNERSSHDRPVLRGLGLAVLVAMSLGYWLALNIDLALSRERPGLGGLVRAIAAGDTSVVMLSVLAGAVLLCGLLGFGEDLRGLSVPVRSVFLLLISAAASIGLIWIVRAGESAGGVPWQLGIDTAELPLVWLVLLGGYGILFVSGYINVANFMDGLNGISGFHGVIAGLAFAAAGWLTGLSWLVAAGAVLAAGFAGFLPWNLSKPGGFLGDVGSYLLGGAVAITSFAAWVSGVPLLAAIGPMVIYFGDVGVTLVKRVRAGHKWDEPHKEHAYQRIQQLGYSHVQASAITAACTLLTSILGLASCFTGLWGTLALLVAGLGVVVFYLRLPKLLPIRTS